jgi:hypothetical protein
MGAYISAKGNFYTIVFLVLIGLFGGMWFSLFIYENFIYNLEAYLMSFNDGKVNLLIDMISLTIGIITVYFTFRYSIAIAMSGGLRGGMGRIGDIKIPLTGGKRTPKLAKGEGKEISNKMAEFQKYHTYGWNLMWRPKTKVELLIDDRKEVNRSRVARYKVFNKVATWKWAIAFIAFLFLLDTSWKLVLLVGFLFAIYVDTKHRIVEWQIKKQVEKELKQGYCALSPLEGLPYTQKMK